MARKKKPEPKPPTIRARLMGLVDAWRERGDETDVSRPAHAVAYRELADELETLVDGNIGADLNAITEALDSILTKINVDDVGLVEGARLATKEYHDLREEKERLQEKLEDSDADVYREGYHAFATQLGWTFPNGEPMPSWAQLDYDTRAAFEAYADAVKPEPEAKDRS